MARDRDYSVSATFLARFFGPVTEHAVEIRALPQEHGAGRAAPLFTRDEELIVVHCQVWDGPGRAVYFACATRITGSPVGNRAALAELPALWVDIDCDKLGLDKDAVVLALRGCPLPPNVIVDSGGGIHAYWLLREAICIRVDVVGVEEREAAIVAVLRQLAGICCGDMAVCDLARIMRLPGTDNWKTGSPRLCSVLYENWDARHEFSEIVEKLDWMRPIIVAPERPKPAAAAAQPPADPYLDFARRYGIKAPIDVEARIAAMSYMSDGDAGVHQTQLHVSASLCARGIPDDDIVALLMEATRRAAGIYAASWSWHREERNIRRMIETARAKFPKAEAEVADVNADASADTSSASASSADSGQAVAGDTVVVNFAEERAARKKAPASGDDKRPLICRVGDAVIDYWRDTYGRIGLIEGEPYTCRGGLWTMWGKAEFHDLKVAIQGVMNAAKLDPKTATLNAVARYVLEHPSLVCKGVEWDASGLIVCLDGTIDPLTRVVWPHSPDHWATAGAQVRIADMGQGCPQWLAFLDGCFSDLAASERALVIAALQEWFGAALVKRKHRELRKALWLYGESRTGKTRLAEVLRLLIGEPTCGLKLRSLERNFGAAALIGKRAWIADDAVGPNDEVDDSLLKVIVTGELLSIDVKNLPHATVRLDIPVLFTGNSLPRVRDQSDAVYNRSLLIHMRVVRSEEETADAMPIDEIVAGSELAGVFSWALDGWARLKARGRFISPPSMSLALNEFKSANNPIAAWASVALESASEWMVDRRDLYASFRGWYIAEYGESAKVPSQKFLTNGLRQCVALGDDEPKRRGYPQTTGIKLTEEGLTYRRESSREAGVPPGSGCSDREVNRPRPTGVSMAENPVF